MKYEYDPTKNAANLAKHGIALSNAALLNWERVYTYPDTRHDYGEVRMIGLALLGARLHTVVFVDRGDVRRIISLRKSHKKEVKTYVHHIRH